jgi:TolB-like protein/DNA-binding winged helix-turn-helix (wHTH) protein/Flp pilus assembly protein TadD
MVMADPENGAPRLVRFGDFELDLRTGELRRDGRRVRLPHQPFKLLALLAAHPGELVTREEIRRALWSEGTFVDFEHGVNACVKQIRAALSDDAGTPRFVETLPRRGYRFIAPVTCVREQPAAAAARPRRGRPAALLAFALALTPAPLAWVAARGLLPREPLPSAAASERRLMLAVLPFDSLDGAAEHDYLVDGLTEEMIAQLGRVQPERLGVIARTSAMHYKGRPRDLKRAAAELGVAFLVEGSLRRQGERVRVTARLVRASDLTQVWSQAYERGQADLLELQDELARAIAREALPALALESRGTDARRRLDAKAYELYLRGRYCWNRRDEPGVRQAIRYFEEALAREPNDALLHVGIADAYLVLGDHGYLRPQEAWTKARAASARALALDPRLAEAHTAAAWIRGVYEWDWQGSVAGFERAIALNPNSAPARHWYSHCLRAVGRLDDALREIKSALELDPLSLMINTNVATALLYAGRLEEAEVEYRRTLELDAAWLPALWGLGRAQVQLGRSDGLESLRRAARAPAASAEYQATLIWGLSRAGRLEEARAELRALQELARSRYVPTYDFAVAFAAVGDAARALEWLERAYAERQSRLRLLLVDERLSPLRGDPRYARLLARVGLPAPPIPARASR